MTAFFRKKETLQQAPEILPEKPASEAVKEIREAAAKKETPAVERAEKPEEETGKKQAPGTVSGIPDKTLLPTRIPRDEIILGIEKILAEDLEETYLKMEPHLQRAFKKKGEETAGKIRKIVRAAKINAQKIVQLIIDWLRIIPHVNRFFLEQEAKIKTDRIINMVARKREKSL